MINPGTRTCEGCGKPYTIETEDLDLYKKFDASPSEECPYCRWKHLLSFWALGKFRVATSALSGKRIITILPPSVPFPIYEREEFVSDAWDPLSYGREYNSSQNFIDQLRKLQSTVPRPHQTGMKNVDCEWTDDWWESRECYLCRSGLRNEHLSYSYRVLDSKNSIDLTYSYDMERSYDCLHCFKSYELRHSFHCRDCLNSAFLYDCRNCSNCFMSWNLRNKQFYILNQPYSKEGYFEKLKNFDVTSYAAVERFKREFSEYIRKDAVHRADYNVQTTNSTGNFLTENKNCSTCFFLDKSENCRSCFRGYGGKDCIDMASCLSEKSAMGALDQWGYENICNLYTGYCRYSAYLDHCEECEYCFGCVGLRKKKYCILNKQYSEGEYAKLSQKIRDDMKKRGKWGKILPGIICLFGLQSVARQFVFSGNERKGDCRRKALGRNSHTGIRGCNSRGAVAGYNRRGKR